MGIDVYTPTKALIAEDYWKAQAASLLGIDASTAVWSWDDEWDVVRDYVQDASVATALRTLEAGGVLTLDATAGGYYQVSYGNPGYGTNYTSLALTQDKDNRWVFAFRMRVDTAGASSWGCASYLVSADLTRNNWQIGYNRAINATKFTAIIDPGVTPVVLTSSVDVDNTLHSHRVWCDGVGTLYYQVDSETPVSTVLGTLSKPSSPAFRSNDSTKASWDWWYIMSERGVG